MGKVKLMNGQKTLLNWPPCSEMLFFSHINGSALGYSMLSDYTLRKYGIEGYNAGFGS